MLETILRWKNGSCIWVLLMLHILTVLEEKYSLYERDIDVINA